MDRRRPDAPLILVIGITGFYLNHSQTVLRLLGDGAFSESRFKDTRPAHPVTAESARTLAETIWPDLPVLTMWAVPKIRWVRSRFSA